VTDTRTSPRPGAEAGGRGATESAGRGYVHLYTGDGKGKTTAAFGLAVRAAGHGKRVYVGQFMKGRPYGENLELSDHPLITVEQYGEPDCISIDQVDEHHRELARSGLRRSREALFEGDYDVVVLDEIDVAIWFGLLSVSDVMDIVKQRPPHVELIMTGRQAPAALVKAADLVTEMREVKHYYRDGVLARAGVEY